MFSHSFALFAVAITLNAVTAGKILGIAGSVYVILQAVKSKFPAIGGWGAVALNIALAVIGAAVLFPPDQLFSLQTITTLLVTAIGAASAAGIHGTINNLSGPAATPAAPAPKQAGFARLAVVHLMLLAAVVLLMLPIAGCSAEQSARDTIAAATGLISSAQVEYKAECTANPALPTCLLINEAVRAQKLAITGLEIYCGFTLGVSLPTDVCTPVTTAKAGLTSALANLKPFLGQLKTLLKKSAALDRARDKEASLLASCNQLPTFSQLESVRIEVSFGF